MTAVNESGRTRMLIKALALFGVQLEASGGRCAAESRFHHEQANSLIAVAPIVRCRQGRAACWLTRIRHSTAADASGGKGG